MTTYEHAMLGIDGVLAAGLHRRHGWQIAATAAVAAVGPDWDGLTIAVNNSLFADAHRLWGHNLLACLILGVLVGAVDYRFDLVTRLARRLVTFLRLKVPPGRLRLRDTRATSACGTWIVVSVVAAMSQLPADMVVSGTATLSDWELKPFWPFWDRGFVCALVPWGDPGVSVIFISGMFAMIYWRTRVQPIAVLTLLLVLAYLVIRGALF